MIQAVALQIEVRSPLLLDLGLHFACVLTNITYVLQHPYVQIEEISTDKWLPKNVRKYNWCQGLVSCLAYSNSNWSRTHANHLPFEVTNRQRQITIKIRRFVQKFSTASKKIISLLRSAFFSMRYLPIIQKSLNLKNEPESAVGVIKDTSVIWEKLQLILYFKMQRIMTTVVAQKESQSLPTEQHESDSTLVCYWDTNELLIILSSHHKTFLN